MGVEDSAQMIMQKAVQERIPETTPFNDSAIPILNTFPPEAIDPMKN